MKKKEKQILALSEIVSELREYNKRLTLENEELKDKLSKKEIEYNSIRGKNNKLYEKYQELNSYCERLKQANKAVVNLELEEENKKLKEQNQRYKDKEPWEGRGVTY